MFAYRTLQPRPVFNPFPWDELFRGFDELARGAEPTSSAPRLETKSFVEEDDKFVLRIDVPGLSEKDVTVELHDGVLTVAGERTVTPPEGYSARRRERGGFRVSRSYAVGEAADPDKTTAEIRDGVLTVSVGKAPAAQKKTITVKAA